jgi:DNA-binding MarR family transcriptional regulator
VPLQAVSVNRLDELLFTLSVSQVKLWIVAVKRSQDGQKGSWTLLTGHGHVLVAIAREPDARLRDISARIGLTERAVQLIVADLVAAGYVVRHRVGRRNYYTVNTDSAFRHPDQEGHQVGPFLALLATAGGPGSRPETPPTGRARPRRAP